MRDEGRKINKWFLGVFLPEEFQNGIVGFRPNHILILLYLRLTPCFGDLFQPCVLQIRMSFISGVSFRFSCFFLGSVCWIFHIPLLPFSSQVTNHSKPLQQQHMPSISNIIIHAHKYLPTYLPPTCPIIKSTKVVPSQSTSFTLPFFTCRDNSSPSLPATSPHTKTNKSSHSVSSQFFSSNPP